MTDKLLSKSDRDEMRRRTNDTLFFEGEDAAKNMINALLDSHDAADERIAGLEKWEYVATENRKRIVDLDGMLNDAEAVLKELAGEILHDQNAIEHGNYIARKCRGCSMEKDVAALIKRLEER